MDLGEQFWSERYKSGQTGWDVGGITPPLKAYFDQLNNKSMNILIPGGGNAYEAEYLFRKGFKNVSVVDISKDPLEAFSERVPGFPSENLIHDNFFNLQGSWDLIIEQTFFSAILPSQRDDYAEKCKRLLNPQGKLVGVLFDDPLFEDRPPYGGSSEDYLPVFESRFLLKTFERCYNSLKPRQGRELFINLVNVD